MLSGFAKKEWGAPACIHAWKDPKEPTREERGIEPDRAAMLGLGEFPFLRRIVMDRKKILVLLGRHRQSVCFSCRDKRRSNN